MEKNGGASHALVTYKIVSDVGGRLKSGAKTACNFWNGFVVPRETLVMRIGTFTSLSNTMATSYRPYRKGDVLYTCIKFNATHLGQYADDELAAAIVHEIGAALGFCWEVWEQLFNLSSTPSPSDVQATLSPESDRVRTSRVSGIQPLRCEQEQFDEELLAHFKDATEQVLPVTINAKSFLDQGLIERIASRSGLAELLREATRGRFSRHAEAQAIDRDHLEETELFELVPHISRLRA